MSRASRSNGNCAQSVADKRMLLPGRRSKQEGWVDPALPRHSSVRAAEEGFGSRGILDLAGYTGRHSCFTAGDTWKSCPC